MIKNCEKTNIINNIKWSGYDAVKNQHHERIYATGWSSYKNGPRGLDSLTHLN